MMIAGHASFSQATELFLADDAVGCAEIYGKGIPHFFIGCHSHVKLPALQGSARGDDSKAVHTCPLVSLDILNDFFGRKKWVFVNARMMTGSLSAICAVLAALSTAPVPAWKAHERGVQISRRSTPTTKT